MTASRLVPNIGTFRELAGNGFSLIPLNGKAPIETQWQQWCRTKREFTESDYHGGRNAGVCCGPASGVIVLDIDDQDAFVTLCNANGWETPETFTVRTGSGGYHHYYAYPDDGERYGCRKLKHPIWKGHTIFDVQADGGQVVAPGSIHPDSGRMYVLENAVDPAPVPDWLKRCILGERLEADVLVSVALTAPLDREFIDSLELTTETAELILTGKPQGQRSEAIGKVIPALIGSGCNDQVVKYIFDHYAIGEKYREKGGSRDSWLTGEIRRAREYIGREHRELEIVDTTPATPHVDKVALEERARTILDAKEPCPPFDTSFLPSVLESYIRSICSTTEAEPIAVTQSVLCTISAFMQKRCCIPDGVYFQRLYPNVWMLTIAPSGNFKTTALNKGAKLAFQADKQIGIDLADLEGQDDETAAALRQDLMQRCLILPNRVTAEGLLQHLAEGSGGMIVCSEFGEWLQNLQRNHNQGLKPLMTDLYDVPNQYSYRTSSQGLLIVREPFISINGMSTLAWVRANIKPSDVSSGFFARFLIFFPPQNLVIPPALPLWTGKQHDGEEQIKQILTSMPESREYELDPMATELFESFHHSLYKGVDDKDEKTKHMLGPYQKRWSPYLLKIAMLLQPFNDSETNQIGPGAIEGAKSVVDYAIKSTTHLFQNDLGETEQQGKQRKVKEYIARRGGRITHSVLQKSRVLDGGTMEYEYVINSLDDAGELVVDRTPTKKGAWIYTLSTNP